MELLLEQLGYGHTIEELLDDYPHLTVEAIHAALLYAADFLNHEALQRYEQWQHVSS